MGTISQSNGRTESRTQTAGAVARRRPVLRAVPLATCVALGGCVTLDVTPTGRATGVAARQGVEYRLPFTRVKGTLVRRLAKCGPKPEIAVMLEGVAFQSAPDWTQRYVIDVQSLSAPMKTSSLKIERYPNGQLKSVNAEAEDRSAAVIASVASTTLKFLVPVAPLGGGTAAEECQQGALDALNDATRIKGQLARDTATLTADTKTLTGLTELLQQAGGAADRGLRNAITNAARAVQGSRDAVTNSQQALDKALGTITLKEEFTWPELPTDFGPKLMPLQDAIAGKWFKQGSVQTMQASSCIQFWLEADRNGAPDPVDAETDAALTGIRYRESEPGSFVARLAPEPPLPVPNGPPPGPCGLGKGEEQYRLAGEVFQFGRLMSLPFRNRAFQSNSIAATWDENGRLTSVSYGERTASAETVAKLAGDLMTAGRDTIAARRGEELAAMTRQNAILEARIKQAELNGKLMPKADPNAEALANFDADKRIADAEAASIQAEIALAKARAEQASLP